MIWAYIENGVVKDRVRVDPFTVFSHQYASQFIEAPDGVDPGWLYDDELFAPPPEPPVIEQQPQPAPTKEQLLAQLQALQAQIESLE